MTQETAYLFSLLEKALPNNRSIANSIYHFFFGKQLDFPNLGILDHNEIKSIMHIFSDPYVDKWAMASFQKACNFSGFFGGPYINPELLNNDASSAILYIIWGSFSKQISIATSA